MVDFSKLIVHDGKHWEVTVHESQIYLGRLVLWAKRDDDVDIADIEGEELEEMNYLLRKIKSVLVKTFKPDRFNYANLQNVSHHLHVHIIPRYETPRTFEGMKFVDERWNQNCWPYDKTKKYTEEFLIGLKKILEGEMG